MKKLFLGLILSAFTQNAFAVTCDVSCHAFYWTSLGSFSAIGTTCTTAYQDVVKQCESYRGSLTGGGCTQRASDAIYSGNCTRKDDSWGYTTVTEDDYSKAQTAAYAYCQSYCKNQGPVAGCTTSANSCRK